MPASIQEWLAGAAVLVALGWLLRRAWRRRRQAGVCAGCDRCPMAAGTDGSATTPTPPGFVPLESLRRFSDEAISSR